MDKKFYTFIFQGYNQQITLNVQGNTKISELIKLYFEKIQKSNLLINNIENTYFVYNSMKILDSDYDKKVCEYFKFYNFNNIFAMNSYNSTMNFELLNLIKKNLYTGVYKAKINNNSHNEYVAVKKIYKEKLKEELMFKLCKKEITEDDFLPEIQKFNKEIENMQKCYCSNSVRIIDYYNTEKEFVIIMELCDDNLLHLLTKKEKGFNENEIKDILLQLNNVFLLMNKNNISHRDIKLNNILIQYSDREKTKFKVLLSDYGISNQLCSMTQKFMSQVGSHLIMAPEILKGEKYDTKCDLWSLGVIIFQLYTKKYPYYSPIESGVLKLIEKKGQNVLNEIKDEKLKDLMSRLLVENPEKRISWEDYFDHSFFK